jgi:20S proteasome subunit alpha 6
VNTQEYGRRPYGVGFLVIGLGHTSAYLYELSPGGTSIEYFAVSNLSNGAHSQSAKTHIESFADCTIPYRLSFALGCLNKLCTCPRVTPGLQAAWRT